MAFIIGAEKREQRADPTIEGTPAHFAAFVRGACVKTNFEGVRTFKPVPGFKVPADGAWTVNGLFRAPGEEIDIEAGDIVAYTTVQPHPDDEEGRFRASKGVTLVEIKPVPATSDRVTGAVHIPQPGAKEVAVIDGHAMEATPTVKRALAERRTARRAVKTNGGGQ